MIGGDAEINGIVLQHLENGLQHTNDCAIRPIFAFGEPPQTVEVTKEFVGAVDEVNYHTALDYADETA